ncbi:MAG: hypothetical protein HLX50_08480 [Alteromonadaceae bacterium]|nr:hypothetical protein [Alteromonadaceae bacterium]
MDKGRVRGVKGGIEGKKFKGKKREGGKERGRRNEAGGGGEVNRAEGGGKADGQGEGKAGEGGAELSGEGLAELFAYELKNAGIGADVGQTLALTVEIEINHDRLRLSLSWRIMVLAECRGHFNS